MAVTNRMSLDLAPVPFLWVLPLALYLLSFVVTFSGERRYRRSIAMFIVPLAVAGLAWAMSGNLPDETEMAIELRLALFAAGLFGLCWVLHGELYRLRPDVTRLTGYYLSISVGGAIGGAFVGLIAPRILPMYWEFQIGQALTLLAVPAALAIDESSPLRGFKPRWAWLLLGIAFLLWADATRRAMGMDLEGTLAHSRSFFGVTRVFEDEGVRELRHGTTTHGVQWTEPEWRRTPISYYGEESGVGRAIALLEGKRRIGVVGLGTGTMAAYGRRGDVVRFYEIDAEVEHIARVWFWYLQDCEADLSVVLGDGRLQLERDEAQNFDVLVLDAFSSDSIPVHLLTLEAFAEYTRHVKPGGMLAVHITNRYVDLQPVIAAAARETGLSWVLIDDGREGDDLLSTDWALMSTDAEKLSTLGQTINPRVKDVRPWTDDYSNIFRVMK
jgi:spermidine synthase